MSEKINETEVEKYIKTRHILQTISKQSTKQCDKCYRENVKI